MAHHLIRPADLSDIPELLRMTRQFAAEAAHVPFDADSTAVFLQGLIESEVGVVFVAPTEGGLCAMLALVSFPHFINAHVKAAQEFFWWVDREHRGNGVAKDLLKAAEDWARSQGCATIHMIALDRLEGDAVGRVYERRGYTPLERTYVRHL